MARRQTIFALAEKMKVLMEWAEQERVWGLSTHRAIEETTKIDRTSLSDDIKSERMTYERQQKLASAFGFDVEWSEWTSVNLDSSKNDLASLRIQRHVAARAFKEKLIRAKHFPSALTVNSGKTKNHIDRRFADFSLNIAGSFIPSEDRTELPLVLSLSFDRRGWSILFERTAEAITVGLKQVDVQLSFERDGALVRVNDLPCNGSECNFKGEALGLGAWWVISVVDENTSWLMDRRSPNDGEDCVLSGFQIGDEVVARMTARAHDCFVSLAGEPFDNVSEAKKKFISHLVKLDVLQGAEAVIGEQILAIARQT